jgi:hypothetical protein
MIDAGVVCAAYCGTCLHSKDIDLGAIAARRGRDFGLWGKRTPCRLSPGCRGKNVFYLVEKNGRVPMWDF